MGAVLVVLSVVLLAIILWLRARGDLGRGRLAAALWMAFGILGFWALAVMTGARVPAWGIVGFGALIGLSEWVRSRALGREGE
jgi:amino acid transporter